MARTWRVRRAVILGLTLAGAAVGCHRPSMLHVPLTYRPTELSPAPNIEGGLPGALALAVMVVDSRSERVDIGENVQTDLPVPVLPEKVTPEQFLKEAVSLELGRAGFAVVSDPSHASRTLSLDLRRFWAEESGDYRSTIYVNAELKDPSGKLLWQGGVAGDNKRSGPSLSLVHYQQGFSDAAIDLVQKLVKNEAFLHALQPPDATPQKHKPRPRH